MSESEGTPIPESREHEPTLWFSLLDVVKIDDKWAQIVGRLVKKGGKDAQLVHYLTDNSYGYVDFNTYELAEHLQTSVGSMIEAGEISSTDFEKIRWDSENIGTKRCENVNVFGSFNKKAEETSPNSV